MPFNQLAALSGLCLVAACATPRAPQLTGLGDNHFAVTTKLVESQEYLAVLF